MDIEMDTEQLIHMGLDILKRNLAAFPPFDPNEPYEDKNKYFLEVSQLSAPLFANAGMVAPAERYYRTMIDAIQEYEKQSSKKFNKGIVYANLGIILTAHGNLDEGIHYLLLADREDEPFRRGPHGLLDHVIWQQFEDHHVIAHLTQLNANPNVGLRFIVDKAFILGFLRTLELPDRLLLEATIWTTFRNLDFKQVNSNDYTRGRLVSGLKDLCLLTEMLLRKKQQAVGQTLGPLLNGALVGKGIGYPRAGLSVRANSLSEFLNNLETILHAGLPPEIRRIYCLHLVRNFTGHHFDISTNVVSATGNEFFSLYEETLINILSAVLYLAHEGLI
jgi:hypothetical protein